MKVLTICTDYLPNIGGISNHIFHLNKNLLMKGIDAVVLHICEESNKNHLFLEEVQVDGNKCFRLHIKDRLVGFNKIKYRSYIFKLINQHFSDTDIIHTHEFTSTLFLVPKEYKWIWTNHTSHFFRFFSERSLVNTIFSPLIRFKLSKADCIITVSDLYRRKTLEVLPNLIEMIPNGIDIDSYKGKCDKFDLPQNKIKILISARWSKVKGIHIVLDLMKRLEKNTFFSNLIFVFAGSGLYEDENYYNKLIRRIERFDNKILFDRVSYEDMPSLYKSVDLVLIPSLFESASIVALEALAANKIVLASNVGGLPELIKHKVRGFLFEEGNCEDLEKKLFIILSKMKTEDLQHIRDVGYKFCSDNYDWSMITDKTINIYQKILS